MALSTEALAYRRRCPCTRTRRPPWRQKKTMRRMGLLASGLATVLGMRNSPDNSSIPSRVRAVCMGFALLGLSSGAAQAQVVTEFRAGITAGAVPEGITAGPDGNLWFTEFTGNRIGRITPLGVVTEFSAGITAGAYPRYITAGSDGNLWFTEAVGDRIGRITTGGVVTEFSAGITAGASPYGITAGPDGNLWFTED